MTDEPLDLFSPHVVELISTRNGHAVVDDTRTFTAEGYLAAGWHPIPLPAGRKLPPPDGVTGYDGVDLTAADLGRIGWAGNIAVRMSPEFVGIDVDAYHGGLETFAGLVDEFGSLPPTVMTTARDDRSGIRFYRVPAGTTLRTAIAPGIEIVQWFHRYAVVAPSTNPDHGGRPYRWVDERTGEVLAVMPSTGELPELPSRWVEGLTPKGGHPKERKASRAATPGEVVEFLRAHTGAAMPASIGDGGLVESSGLIGPRKRLESLPVTAHGQPGGRHDRAMEVACWAMREARAGLYPATEALAMLEAWWAEATGGGRDGEVASIVVWAIAEANAEDDGRIAEIRAKVAGDKEQSTPPMAVLTFRSPPRPLVVAPVEWLARGLWARHTHGELAGPEKSLKSYLGMIIDVALAAGVPVLGRFDVAAPARVLQLVGEGGEHSHLRRLKRVCDAYGLDVTEVDERLRYSVQTAQSTTPRFVDGVRSELDTWQPALVHIDPWYAYHSASVDSRNLYEQGAALEQVGGLVREGGASLLINNHFNQTGSGDGLTRITGAGHAEWVDSWLLVSHRERADVAAGRFALRLNVGSRQWGGSVWDVDLTIGRFDEIAGDHAGSITWTVTAAGAMSDDDAHDADVVKRTAARRGVFAAMRKARRPLAVSEIVHRATGAADVYLRAETWALVDEGQLLEHDVRRSERNGHTTTLYVLSPEAGDGPR